MPSVCEKMKAFIPDSIIVEASHALLQPVAVSGSNPIYSVLGTDARTGQTVLCSSSSNGSRVAVRPDQSIPITVA
jgi:hypothetical protein